MAPSGNLQEIVLQCIKDLTNSQRPANRILIAQYLGWELGRVDDAVKRLKEDGLVRTTVPGYVEPVETHPPSRPVSNTLLPDGTCILEVGDDQIRMTPHEAQMVGKQLQGHAMEMAYWYEERRRGEDVARLQAEVRALRHQLRTMSAKLARSPRGGANQAELPFFEKPTRRPPPA